MAQTPKPVCPSQIIPAKPLKEGQKWGQEPGQDHLVHNLKPRSPLKPFVLPRDNCPPGKVPLLSYLVPRILK